MRRAARKRRRRRCGASQAMTSPDSPSPAIAPLVALVRNGAAGDQERTARALANLAYDNATNKVAIAEAGGIAALVALVTNGAAGGREQAAGALGNLARNDTNRVAIAEALVVAANRNNEQIVRAMKAFANDDSSNRAALAKALVMAAAANGRGIQLAARTVERFTRGDAANRFAVANAVAREGDQAWVARAMHSLTYGHAANRATIAAGLVALMASKRDQNRAARAMETFSRGKADNCVAIAEADGIAALVQHVASGKAETATLAVLRRLACDAVGIGTRYFLRVSTQLRGHTYVHADILAYIKPKNRATIVDALVALVASGAAGGQERAAAALAVLACDVPNQTAIAAAGGVVALVALAGNGTVWGRIRASQALSNLAVVDIDANGRRAEMKGPVQRRVLPGYVFRRVPRVSPVLPRTNYRQAWEQRENSQMPKPGIYDHCRNDVGDIMERIDPVIQAYYEDKVVTYQGKTNRKKLYLGVVNALKRL